MNDDYSSAIKIKEDIEDCVNRKDNTFSSISSSLIKPSVRQIVGELTGESQRRRAGNFQKGTETILDRALSLLRNIEIYDFRLVNILETLKDTRIDLCGTDLSFLDLRKISLNNVRLGYGEIEGILRGADLRGSMMSPYTLFPEGYEGHSCEVNCLALSPDGKTLISASSDRTVKEWDILTGYCRKTFKIEPGFPVETRFTSYSRDAKKIISVNKYGIIRIWDRNRGDIIKSHTIKSGEIYGGHISHDGSKIILASNVITEVNLHTGEIIKTYRGHSYKVNSVCYSKDGLKILSGGSYGEMKEWDTASGECVRNFQTTPEEITSVSYSPDGKMIACSSKEGIIKEYDSETGKCLRTCRSRGYHIITLTYSPDGSKIASVSKNKIIEEWDMESGALLKTFKGHLWDVNSILYSSDGERIFSASSDRTIKEWDVATGDIIRTYEKLTWNINFITSSPDGKRIFFSGGDNSVKELDSLTGICVRIYTGHSLPVLYITISPDSSKMATGSEDGTVKEWSVLTGECLGTCEGHKDRVTSLSYDSDGKKILSAGDDCTVKEFDTVTGKYVKNFEGHEKGITQVSYRGDKVIAISAHKVILWDLSTGEILKTHDFSSADSVSYSGVIVTKEKITDYEDYIEIKEWNAETGECVGRSSDYLTKDERIISHKDWNVLESDRGTVKKWDGNKGEYSLEIRNIPGLFIQGVNMEGVNTGEEEKHMLKQYGALTGED